MGALLLLINAGLLVPVLAFAVEVFSALLPGRPGRRDAAGRPALAVLVPAHDEAPGIAATLAGIGAQLRPGDRLLVVADNCADETAAIARAAGAEVVERIDPHRRGKGYALDFGARHLAPAPPAVVVIVDADCTLGPGALDLLVQAAAETGRPVQGRYLMHPPVGGGLNLKVSAFAFRVKNWVRPRGLHRLGLSCQLTGSGMAFPWQVLTEVNLAGADLAEDMKLGLDLALKGHPPVYCEAAAIDSTFPETAAGEASQRRRWEEGHLAVMRAAFAQLPAALARGNIAALGLILDLLVPPFTLLLLAVGGIALATAAVTIAFGLSPAALALAAMNCTLLLLAVGGAWMAYGRDVLPARALWQILPFIARKLGLYRGLAAGKRAQGWVRTDRGPPEG